MNNLILLTDSYKVTHHRQYPKGIGSVYSYLECREGARWPETTFFGLQYILKRYLAPRIRPADVEYARARLKLHFGLDLMHYDGWMRIATEFEGRLPLTIKAVPEGMTIPNLTPLVTVENSHPDFAWLTNYVESLLVQVWYPSTVCTNSREIKKVIQSYLDLTGTPDVISYMLHDFGFRGSTSVESSAIGGAAHLVNFMGTDTLPALELLFDYYDESMAGYSIPAAEHSTVTSWGKDKEVDFYRHMLTEFPTGLVAVVSDTYDIFNACGALWGTELHDQVINREGRLVIRPDSGDPPSVISLVLTILGEKFGSSVNAKGFHVLPDYLRLIQGDGIDLGMVETILERMHGFGWSADNVAFGSGGGLLQKVNRDTQRFAFKASEVVVDNEVRAVSKSPVTDMSKASKSGRFAVYPPLFPNHVQTPGSYSAYHDLLQLVFHNGVVISQDRLTEIRARAEREFAEYVR